MIGYCPNPDLVWRPMTDGGLLLVNRASGDHWTLNAAAKWFLYACADGAALDEAIARVAAHYPTAAEAVKSDLFELLAVLQSEGILEPRPGG